MADCVICIRLPAVAGVPVIGMLEMAGVLGGIGAPGGMVLLVRLDRDPSSTAGEAQRRGARPWWDWKSIRAAVPGRAGHPWTLGAGTGMKKTGELAGAGQRARGVTVQAGDRGGALLPRSATSPAREPPA